MKQQLWKKREKTAAAGVCAALLGIAGLTGYGVQETYAKTVYWEVGTKEETQESAEDRSGAELPAEASESQGIWEDEYAEDVKNAFQYLEKYHVTYDADTASFFYDGRRIRWLIDELTYENTQKCCYNDRGTIDVYTVRDKDGDLEGVRVADDEEYREKTDRMDMAVLVEEDDAVYEAVDEEDGAYEVTYVLEDDAIGDFSGDYEGTAASGFVITDSQENGLDSELFRALGLEKNKDGHWRYNDRTVSGIYISGIGITTWGDVQERDAVFLSVTREQKEGEIDWKISEVTEEELFEISQGNFR